MAFDARFIDEVRDRTSLVTVVGDRVQLKRAGREWKAPCPFHREKTASFTVNEAKGFFHCFGCGAHGDAIAFVMRHDNLDFAEAVRRLAADAGLVEGEGTAKPVAPKVHRASDAELRAEKEASIARGVERYWTPGLPWAGTVVETYLRDARRIDTAALLAGQGRLPLLPSLRYLPAADYWHGDGDRPRRLGQWPAMAGIMVALRPDGTKRLSAVHVTYLARDGSGKAEIADPADPAKRLPAKKMFGQAWGAAIWLHRPGEVLAIAEGIETGASVALACPDLPVWVAGSLGNLSGAGDPKGPTPKHPVRDGAKLPTVVPDFGRPGLLLPDCVLEVVVLGDADGDRPTGRALVERAVRRWSAQGRKVRVAWPRHGTDFNDMLRATAAPAAVARAAPRAA